MTFPSNRNNKRYDGVLAIIRCRIESFLPERANGSRNDIARVGTDPGLALRTRKGTGFYKIPSLRGVWYRPRLLHDASVTTLLAFLRSL